MSAGSPCRSALGLSFQDRGQGLRRRDAACLLTAILALTGCAQVERTSGTTLACTAAFEALDNLDNASSEQRPLREFLERAREAENPQLVEAAASARAADRQGRIEDVRRALARARAVCEQQGGV